jgi:GNAT superfamily N-acetyltransferase
MQVGTQTSIRRMLPRELEWALDWAAAEGWNPGLFDAAPFFAADPDGFLLAESDGQPVGCFSAVAYDAHFGFAGLYIVRPDLRGGRLGLALGQAGLERLGSRCIGLDGVPAKQKNYQKLGFRPAYRTIRYQGESHLKGLRATDGPSQFVDLRSLPLEQLAAYDAHTFPAPRPQFLQAWISQPGTTALGVIRLDRLAGYGVLRPCRVGYKVGPLVADDPALAEVLFEGLLATAPGTTVYLDVPEPNQAATDLAQRHGMKPVSETARMYRGPAPAIPRERVFGITSLELG